MKNYLWLRLRILGREVAALGWPRGLVLGPMLLAVLGQVLQLPEKTPAGA